MSLIGLNTAVDGTTPGPASHSRRLIRLVPMLLLACAVSAPCFAQLGFIKALQSQSATTKSDAKSAKPAAPAPDGTTAEQPAESQTEAIPLPDVAMRSQQLNQALREVTATLPTQDQLNDVNDAIEERKQELETKAREVDTLLYGAPSTIELREQENYWRGLQSNNLLWRKQLFDWANSSQTAVNQLNQQEPQWTATLNAHRNETALGPVLELLEHNVAAIKKLRAQEVAVLQQVVRMQLDNNALEQQATDTLSRLIQARVAFQGRLLHKDSLPIWRLKDRREVGESTPLFKTASGRWIAIRTFGRNDRGGLIALFVLAVFSLVVSRRLCQLTREAVPENAQQAEVRELLSHWISIGILPALLLAYLLAPDAPVSMLGALILLSFVPILQLLPQMIHPQLRPLLYCLAAMYAVNFVIGWLSLSPVATRELQFVVSTIALCVFAWLVRRARLVDIARSSRKGWYVVLLLRIAVGILALSLLANIFGYVKFAQFLAVGCIYSTFMAICAFTAVRVFSRLLAAAVKSPHAERFALVRLHRNGLLRWIPRLLRWAGILAWLMVSLDLFSLRDAVTTKLSNFLKFPIAGEASGITLGRVLGFFLILLVGYTLATAIRFFMREEILSRFHLSRGVPELIASTVYYLLLLFVFLSAVNAGGVELNKFTVLTGALGVGVGFGLQNIINNFVSGLILQFERPIHIKDVLEVDGQTGTVTRIGIRSSTLQTGQGAEVIIPNATLISGRVTNWTLTEAKRRAELPVGVAYGTNPETVLNLLLRAANMHESVLTNPPPAAYFKGFGDNSLDFELQFWVMQDSNWVKVKSDIGRVVMKSLEEAGIEIPFPQRDLHLRSVDDGVRSQLSANAVADNGTGTKDTAQREAKATGTVAD